MELWIDGVRIQAEEGQTVLQAALAAGIYIPHLCYHPDLEPQGGCKLCVVEIEGQEEIATSCTTPAREGMRVTTKSERLSRLRKAAMEFMLAGHPGDCTGCRSFGSCELQAMMQYLPAVANGELRTFRRKSADWVAKDPLIVREMERCIQCGRCVRACRDLWGVGILDYRHSGDETYVGTEGNAPLREADCRFCGACVEVCPTGALQDREGIFRKDLPREQALIPCQAECPAHIDIPGYLYAVSQGDYAGAVDIIREKVPFPMALGHVCTAYCEKGCKRKGLDEPLAVRDLKRFAVEHDDKELWRSRHVPLPPTGKTVAVVGAGPCGLTAAYYLALKGHKVTVLERHEVPGGMMALGIPAYRLPRETLQKEIAEIAAAGVEIRTGCDVAEAAGLKKEYDAVLVAVGAAQGKRLPLDGANDSQCVTALEVLRAVALTGGHPLLAPGCRVTVLGGGNVAFDAARTALRLGAEARVVCLEDRDHMLSDEEEIVQAQEEGASVCPGRHNLELVSENGRITALRTERITGFRFTPDGLEVDGVPGSEECFPTDVVIFAAGQKSDLTPAFGLPLNRFGYPEHEGCRTAVEGVFVAGDAVTGTKAVIDAIAAGREAAQEMDRFLGGNGSIEPPPAARPGKDPCIGKREGFAQLHRAHTQVRPAQERKGCWDQVDLGYTEQQARAEAERCLSCPLRTQISVPKMWTAYLSK